MCCNISFTYSERNNDNKIFLLMLILNYLWYVCVCITIIFFAISMTEIFSKNCF